MVDRMKAAPLFALLVTLQASPVVAQDHWTHIGEIEGISLDYDQITVIDRGGGDRRVVLRIVNSDPSLVTPTMVEDIEIACEAQTFIINEAVVFTRDGEVGARFPRGFRGSQPITENIPEFAVMARVCPS